MSATIWPQHRDPELVRFGVVRPLLHAWRFSRQRIAALVDCLHKDGLPAEILTVAISGSLSRMEAHDDSDLDLLIVLDDRDGPISAERELQLARLIWSRLKPLGIRTPQAGGIFAECAHRSRLVDPTARGKVDEDLTPFGQRMQLILDAQPLLVPLAFEELQADLLTWYSETRVAALFAEAGVFHWLWQDVQRYWRSLRSRACWLYADEPRRSLEINLKLRSSRLSMIAACLLAVADAHKTAECPQTQQQRLLSHLRKTPLERLTNSGSCPEDSQRLLHNYEAVWEFLQHLPATGNGSATTIPAGIQAALIELRQDVIRCGWERGGPSARGPDWLL